MNKLNVFVSSTCYDLSQVRADLSDHFTNIGHTPILSEYDNFPVNPQKATIENCIAAVKENADIFILIVGSRYGSINDTGKSITNIEFLTAKDKGIPIFIFIEKKTLNAFSFWQDNKDADFTRFVDNIKIFEFIQDVRESSKLWTFEFEKAKDIISIVTIQLSYLFKEALKLKSKIDKSVSVLDQTGLSNTAINIVLQKDVLYEYEFFAQTLLDEMEKKVKVKNDLKYKLHLEPRSFIYESAGILNWISSRMTIISSLISSLSNLVNSALPIYINELGKPSDLRGLFYVSQTYANIYEKVINWTLDVASAHVPENCVSLRDILATMNDTILDQIWNFPGDVNRQINEAKQAYKRNDLNKETELSIMLVLNVGEGFMDKINEAMEELRIALLET